MAIVNLKSSPLTGLDTTPRVYPNRLDDGAYNRHAYGTLQGAIADSIGSTYRLIRVNSRSVIKRLELATDAAGASVTADIGVYLADTGAVVDADLFATLVDISSAVARTDVTNESGTVPIEDANKPLWEQLGLTEDPLVEYDIVLTVAGAALGNVTDVALWAEVLVLD